VTIKGSMLMSLIIIKRFWRNAYAPCHLTQGRGVTNNHIFGIPHPILPIHFATFSRLPAVTIKGSVLMSLPIIRRLWRNAHAPYHMTQCRGVTNKYIFGIPDRILPVHFATFSRLRAVTIKGRLLISLPIIKRFWRNAYATCHVTQGRGVTNNHILGIPDPILPIHFATFRGLR